VDWAADGEAALAAIPAIAGCARPWGVQ